MLKLNKGAMLAAPFIAALFVTSASFGSDQPPAPSDAKFALLVGIDDYVQPKDKAYQVTPLKGPGNDVKMMEKLLIDLYGFKDDDDHILTLHGSNATHDRILESIKSQLIDKAKLHPGATIVFYFSGHGSQSFDTAITTGSGFHQTLLDMTVARKEA